jgi:hypothetical protein
VPILRRVLADSILADHQQYWQKISQFIRFLPETIINPKIWTYENFLW